jgi:hypothetical protein
MFFSFPFLYLITQALNFALVHIYAQLPVHFVWYLSNMMLLLHVGVNLKCARCMGLDNQ